MLNDARFSSDLTGQDRIPLPGAGLPDDLRTALTSTLAAYDHPTTPDCVAGVPRLHRPPGAAAAAACRAHRGRPARGPACHVDAVGTVDLMEHFAHQLPILVIGELLGLPPEEQQQWRTSAEGLTSGDPARVTTDARNLIVYMRKAIAERRDPQYTADDLLTALVRARDSGDRLTEDELVSTALSILLAGHRTTALLVRTMAVLVLTGALRPAWRDPGPGGGDPAPSRVRRDRQPALRAGTGRVGRGATIARGDLVLVVLAS
ncbi:hypothetical protein GTV15_08560, partial [Streptomyces sp. SID7803]|nr:hypothetical protein [Streptomyces sp. SID7803]